jgi:mRNA interferase RelE/StbE
VVYRLVFTQRAVRDLEALDPQVRRRIGDTLARYQREPLQFARRMAAPALGDYRFRIGNYRVIFDLEGDAIVVLRVGHRSQIYRR